MAQSLKGIIGFIILVIVCGAVGWWIYNGTKAADQDIKRFTKQVTIIDPSIVKSKEATELFSRLNNMHLNGNFPLTINPDRLGKVEPFE